MNARPCREKGLAASAPPTPRRSSRLDVLVLSSGWHQSFARQVVEESRAQRAGADSVLTRLAELMFVEVLRRYIARPWTLDELAGDRFTALVGQPPMQYLAQWRKQLAAQRLATSNARVATIAEEVGAPRRRPGDEALRRLTAAGWKERRAPARGRRGLRSRGTRPGSNRGRLDLGWTLHVRAASRRPVRDPRRRP